MSDYVTAAQKPPTQSQHIPILWLVLHDLSVRAAEGIKKYGQPLKGFNGRDALLDAYQEVLDQAMYLRQIIYERDHARENPANDELPSDADIKPAHVDLLGNARVRQLFDELLQWREAMIASDHAHGREIAALRGQHDLLAARVLELETPPLPRHRPATGAA